MFSNEHCHGHLEWLGASGPNEARSAPNELKRCSPFRIEGEVGVLDHPNGRLAAPQTRTGRPVALWVSEFGRLDQATQHTNSHPHMSRFILYYEYCVELAKRTQVHSKIVS